MQAWEQFLQQQERDLGADTVRRWLRTLTVKSFDARNIYLEARDSFQIMWFEEHIRSKLGKALVNNNRCPIRVHLSLSSEILLPKTKRRRRSTAALAEGESFELSFEELDPACTFARLVVSEQNLLAHKIFSEIVEGADTSNVFNPILVYGPSGTGKSHFLMAAAHALREQGVDVGYVRAQTFTDHVVQAIRAGEMSAFRRCYRRRDVLIIDDIDVFSGKASTQEELFHTFNTLHLAGKQIILAGRCEPGELKDIEPRLVSRFEWGIVLPLETFTRDGLLKVLRAKAETLRFPLTQRLEEFLCKTFTRGPRSMCVALEALVLRTHMHQNKVSGGALQGSHISVAMASQLLADFIAEEQRSEVRPGHVVQAVADTYGITVEDICGKGQSRELSVPRQIAMYLCRQLLKMPYTQIGKHFGRDHSTVMASVRQVTGKIKEPGSDFASGIQALTKKLIP